MQSFITINGTKFPQPRRGLELLTLWVQIARRQHNSSLTILKAGIGWNIVMSVNDRHKQQNKFWRLKS